MQNICMGGRENYYALALSIVANYSSDKALASMGLLKKIRSKSQKDKHPSIISLNDKEIVTKMYWEENMTTEDIAKIYKCVPSTVQRYMHEVGIKAKTRGRKKIGNKNEY